MRIRVDVTGDREVQQELERAGEAGRVASVRVLGRAMQRVVPLARALAPVDPSEPGELRATIRISKPMVNRRTGRVSAGIVAGSRALGDPRALVQEIGEARIGRAKARIRLRHRRGGQARYLFVPFSKEAERVPVELLDEVDAEVRRARR